MGQTRAIKETLKITLVFSREAKGFWINGAGRTEWEDIQTQAILGSSNRLTGHVKKFS